LKKYIKGAPIKSHQQHTGTMGVLGGITANTSQLQLNTQDAAEQ